MKEGTKRYNRTSWTEGDREYTNNHSARSSSPLHRRKRPQQVKETPASSKRGLMCLPLARGGVS